LSAHVFSAVLVNSSVTFSPFATETELGSNPCAPTETWTTFPAVLGIAPLADGAAVSFGGSDLQAAMARAMRRLND
jgi:hypothetical protein